MDLPSVTGAPSAAGKTQDKASSASVLASDFDTFLQLLTAQARHQDPLEPMEASEFTAQLAQFSMVEQQIQTNDLLSGLATRATASDIASLSGWVGLEARAPMPVAFDGAPVAVAVNAAPAADAANLVVRDPAGAVVQRIPLAPGAERVSWAGVDPSGQPLPVGRYSFAVESLADGAVIEEAPAEPYARITEARMIDGETRLVFEGGVSIPAGDVSALREGG